MKKITALFFALSLAFNAGAYTWNPVGPDSAAITRICFDVGTPYWAFIEADGLLYLYDYGTQECEALNLGLPVTDAAPLNQDKMLVSIGYGTYSDGIYAFDFETHSTTVVEWYPWPTFLRYDQTSGTYWAGFKNGGALLTSTDGTTWETVPYFQGKDPAGIAFYNEHIIVTTAPGEEFGVYCSHDGGETWSQTVNAPLITDMAFDYNGYLTGIFPDNSYSSGLWGSEDFGETWDVVFWSMGLSSVAFDVFQHIFVGWEENDGVAVYNPAAPPPGLTFFNEGLPSLNINRIATNPWMSAPAIFVCTDMGVWYSIDYMVGFDQPEAAGNGQIIVTPNPATDRIRVESPLPVQNIRILTLAGKSVLFHKVNANRAVLDISTLSPGIYLINVNSGRKNTVKKIIIL